MLAYDKSDPSFLSEYSYNIGPGTYTVSITNETTGEECASTEWSYMPEDVESSEDIFISFDTDTGELTVTDLSELSEFLNSKYEYTVENSGGETVKSGYLDYDPYLDNFPFFVYADMLAQDTYKITVADAETDQVCATAEWVYTGDKPDCYKDIYINFDSRLLEIEVECSEESYYVPPENFLYSYSMKDALGGETASGNLIYCKAQTDYPYAVLADINSQGIYTVEIIDNKNGSVKASADFMVTLGYDYSYNFACFLFNPDTRRLNIKAPADPVSLFIENNDTKEPVLLDIMGQYDETGDMYYYPIIGLDAGNYNFYVTSSVNGLTQLNWQCVPANGKSADVEVFYSLSSDEITVDIFGDDDTTAPTDSDDTTEPTKDTKPNAQNQTSSNSSTKDTASGGAVQTGGSSYTAVMLVVLSAACVFVLFARKKSQLDK